MVLKYAVKHVHRDIEKCMITQICASRSWWIYSRMFTYMYRYVSTRMAIYDSFRHWRNCGLGKIFEVSAGAIMDIYVGGWKYPWSSRDFFGWVQVLTLPRSAWGPIGAHMGLYINGCQCTWILLNFWWRADALCPPHLEVVGQVCSASYSNI